MPFMGKINAFKAYFSARVLDTDTSGLVCCLHKGIPGIIKRNSQNNKTIKNTTHLPIHENTKSLK